MPTPEEAKLISAAVPHNCFRKHRTPYDWNSAAALRIGARYVTEITKMYCHGAGISLGASSMRVYG
jgi:hypothetical protein